MPSDLGGEGKPELIRRRSTDEFSAEFDLRQSYQNAVDCLVQAEAVIDSLQAENRSLRDRLASREGRISILEGKVAGLEGRLVRTSLELASSRTLEDEHRLRLRRQTHSGEGVDPRRSLRPEASSNAEPEPLLNAECTPDRRVRRSRNVDPRTGKTLSRSWFAKTMPRAFSPSITKASSFPQVALMSQTSDQLDGSGAGPFPSAGTRRFAKASFSSSLKSGRSRRGGDLDEASSDETSLTRPLYRGNWTQHLLHDLLNSEGATNRDGSSHIPKLNGTEIRDASDMAASTMPPKRGHSSQDTLNSSADRNRSSTRMSNFGQLLLGQNRNKAAQGRDEPPLEGEGPRGTSLRRESPRPSIEGVLFPVSSGDVLAGCFGSEASFESAGQASSANEEWPKFTHEVQHSRTHP